MFPPKFRFFTRRLEQFHAVRASEASRLRTNKSTSPSPCFTNHRCPETRRLAGDSGFVGIAWPLLKHFYLLAKNNHENSIWWCPLGLKWKTKKIVAFVHVLINLCIRLKTNHRCHHIFFKWIKMRLRETEDRMVCIVRAIQPKFSGVK